jgi:murein DD-endopeptidase MepM/ murein hydrolase activator NlpD
VHVYSLSTGRGTVTTGAGKQVTDKAAIQVSPALAAPAPAAPAKPTGKPPKAPSPAPGPPPAMPPVATTGGSGFAGFSGYSGLSLVGADQALSQFEIPPFLMPIYLSASRAYGVPWPVLAAINKIETDFGRDLSVSSAGAIGWMQFMPEEWKVWGVDANSDGYADPYDPADAIFAAARYLHYAGAGTDLRGAIFAYNHANWYVDEVLQSAGIYGSLPPDLVSETGSLAYGHFPLRGPVTYGDDFASASVAGQGPRALQIHGRGGATAVATQQVKVSRILLDPALTAELKLHGMLAGVAATYTPGQRDAAGAATALLDQLRTVADPATAVVSALTGLPLPRPSAAGGPRPAATGDRRPKHPAKASGLPAGFGVDHTPGITVVVTDSEGNQYSYGGLAQLPGTIRPGALIAGGQAIGSLPAGQAATLAFSVSAAGGVPVNARPLVDGYRLQEAIHFYHAVAPFGANPFVPQQAAPSYSGYVSPFQGYTPIAERIDMGVDYSAPVGSPLVAIGPGRVIGIDPSWYAGQPFVTYQITSGPLTGVYVYYAEQLTPAVTPGQTVAAGQVIGLVAASGTGLELGFGTSVPGQTLAQVTSGYSEGQLTAAGQAYSNLMAALGAPAGLAEGRGMTGSLLGLPLTGGVKADPAPHLLPVAPQPASKAEEAQISQALDRISNPRLAKPSPEAIKVLSPRGGRTPAGSRPPVDLAPADAGAKLQAVAMPPGATAGQAWAIGTVDGTMHAGWARSQTVLLSFSGGTWSLIGPPRDSRGSIVNPHLRALAVNRDGSGYAVGDRGSVVELAGAKPPLLLASHVRAALSSVAVSGSAARLQGIAVGAQGATVDLSGPKLAPHSVASRPTLTAVSLDRAGALIAGSSGGTPVLYRERDGSVSGLPLRISLPGASHGEITSVAEQAGKVWLAGGILDPTGVGAESPLVVHQTARGWQTYCASGPAMAGAVELGTPTPSLCGGSLPVGAHGGPATAIALAPRLTLVGTPDGVLTASQAGGDFHSACAGACSADPPPVSALALGRDGTGWTLGADGHLSQMALAGSRLTGLSAPAAVTLSPRRSGSGPVTVLASVPGGDQVVAAGANVAATLGQGKAQNAAAPGVTLRGLALSAPHDGWGVSDAGSLVRYQDGRWTAADGSSLAAAARLTRQLGATPLTGSSQGATGTVNAVAASSSGEAYAVGAGGLILRSQAGGWAPQPSGVTETLTSVAAAQGQAVAVGTHGTLVERDGSGWAASSQASDLVGGQDFTGTVALPDGTFLALAGGCLIERQPGRSNWSLGSFAPLGLPAARLAAYRDLVGQIHALVLVNGAGGQSLLDGDASGWRPVPLPAGMQVSDLQVDPSGYQAWVGGQVGGQPATSQLALPGNALPTSLTAQGAAALPGSDIEAASL